MLMKAPAGDRVRNVANLEIDLLRTFAAVADTGSFTGAGEVVARSQSAVSLQVKRLEDTLGQKVFERTSRSLALTPAGTLLLGYARRILELNDESVRRIGEPPVTGVIRLGITEYFVPQELPGILGRFAAAYPGVAIEARMGLSSDLRAQLASGALDAAVVRLPPGARAKPLWSEPYTWVAPEGLALTAGATVPLALLRAPCVQREYVLRSMKRLRRSFNVAFTGSSMSSVQAAVVAGLGVSLVPRSSVLPGMRVLPRGRDFPDPGHLRVGVLRGATARPDIVDALEKVIRQTLSVLAVTRLAS